MTLPKFTFSKATFEYVAVALIAAAVSLAISEYVHSRIPVKPLTPTEVKFRALGHTYGPQLAAAYAQAYTDGATALEGGSAYSVARTAVAKSLTTRRGDLVDKIFSAEFAKLVPAGMNDADVTPVQRQNMAAAWRSIAYGLSR